MENVGETVVVRQKLGLGQFYVGSTLCNPISQEDLANGWRMVLPKSSPYVKQHIYNVELSYLPEHLWHKVNRRNMRASEENYPNIYDGIYTYWVKQTTYDNLMFELFEEMRQLHPNEDTIRNLVSELEQHRVKGWLMIRARQFL
jgi:hypothetical protein